MAALKEDLFLRVTERSGVGAARRRVSALARRAGFGDVAVARLAIAVTELGSNLVRHAPGGEMFARGLEVEGVPSVEIMAVDRGPGIEDASQALEDGFTTADGPGMGLGAVRRISDRFDLHSPEEGGTVCVVRVDAEPAPEAGLRAPTRDMGVVRRPHPGEDVSGDAWACREADGGTLIMVCDGLGHGRRAHAASERAVEVFGSHPWRDDLPPLLEALHEALQGTRGAAVSVAAVDPEAGTIRFAGVGNVGGGVVDGSQRVGFLSRNGTVGHQMPSVRAYDYAFPPGSLLVMHSDGLKTRWDPRDFRDVLDRPAPVVAGVFYLLHARERDDATVLVLRNRS